MKVEIKNPEKLREELEKVGLYTENYNFGFKGFSINIKSRFLWLNWLFNLADVTYSKKRNKFYYKGNITNDYETIKKIINAIELSNEQ